MKSSAVPVALKENPLPLAISETEASPKQRAVLHASEVLALNEVPQLEHAGSEVTAYAKQVVETPLAISSRSRLESSTLSPLAPASNTSKGILSLSETSKPSVYLVPTGLSTNSEKQAMQDAARHLGAIVLDVFEEAKATHVITPTAIKGD